MGAPPAPPRRPASRAAPLSGLLTTSSVPTLMSDAAALHIPGLGRAPGWAGLLAQSREHQQQQAQQQQQSQQQNHQQQSQQQQSHQQQGQQPGQHPQQQQQQQQAEPSAPVEAELLAQLNEGRGPCVCLRNLVIS